MDGDFTMARMIRPPRQCEDGLKLRERLLKLRWMRLDGEADKLANEILSLDCELPRTLPRRFSVTD